MIAWRARHGELEARLLAAARVAPERDAERFRFAWRAFVQALQLHLDQEEAVLLPAFERLAERASPNQRPDVVRRDHALLREHLAQLEEDPQTARAIAVRAERLELLADVLHHHDRREAQGMLTVLESSPQAAAWLARFSAEEAALPAWTPVEPREAPPPWPSEPTDALDALWLAAAQDAPLEPAFAAIPPSPARVPARMAAAVERLLAEPVPDLVARRDRARAVVARTRLWRIALETQ